MRTTLCCLAAFVIGCSGKIDSDTDASTTSDGGGSDSTIPGDAIAANGLAGTWVGYVESFKFGDDTDNVTLKIDGTGAGTVFFGPGPALAPPTDPDMGYPPHGVDVRENFAFTNLAPVFAAPRLTFSMTSGEVYAKWCELQTVTYPYYNGFASDGGCGPQLGYNCLPNAATQSSGDAGCSWSSCNHPTWTPVDCDKLKLCTFNSVCQCTATKCTQTLPPSGNIAFDVQLAGNSLDGSVTGLDSSTHNVHLTRQ